MSHQARDGDNRPTLFEGEGRSPTAYPLPAKLLKIKKIQGWYRVAFRVGSAVYLTKEPARYPTDILPKKAQFRATIEQTETI